MGFSRKDRRARERDETKPAVTAPPLSAERAPAIDLAVSPVRSESALGFIRRSYNAAGELVSE